MYLSTGLQLRGACPGSNLQRRTQLLTLLYETGETHLWVGTAAALGGTASACRRGGPAGRALQLRRCVWRNRSYRRLSQSRLRRIPDGPATLPARRTWSRPQPLSPHWRIRLGSCPSIPLFVCSRQTGEYPALCGQQAGSRLARSLSTHFFGTGCAGRTFWGNPGGRLVRAGWFGV